VKAWKVRIEGDAMRVGEVFGRARHIERAIIGRRSDAAGISAEGGSLAGLLTSWQEWSVESEAAGVQLIENVKKVFSDVRATMHQRETPLRARAKRTV